MPGPSQHVLVPVADGTEDIELSCITDILRRGGVTVTVASVMPSGRREVILARGLCLTAETHIDSVCASASGSGPFDAIFLPGGLPGSNHLAQSEALLELLKAHVEGRKLYGAICAAPAVALAPNNLLTDIAKATCFPALRDKMPTGVWVNEPVVLCGQCLTGQGAGVAMAFALSALAAVTGSLEKATEVSRAMLFDPSAIVARPAKASL